MAEHLHISIEILEAIVAKAKKVQSENPNVTSTIRIIKIADRQHPELHDSIQCSLLTTETEIVEG